MKSFLIDVCFQSGLFDVDSSILPDGSRQPAVCAEVQRESDSMRARPRSAGQWYTVTDTRLTSFDHLVYRYMYCYTGVYCIISVHVQGERSLKYEVVRPTRPQSSTTTNARSSKPTSASDARRRPPSGKHSNQPQHATHIHTHVIPDANSNPPAADTANGDDDIDAADDRLSARDSARSERGGVEFDPATFRRLGIDLAEVERAERAPPLRININKPQSVIEFEEDVECMRTMESEITRNALALQKRLGLNTGGLL